MRTWRVGTFSMGTALLALGVLLLLSNFDKDFTSLFLSWWPTIFIILGVEIIVHLFMRKEENPTIKYDVFSILFIAFFGSLGLIFASMSAIGITDEVQAALKSEEKTLDLPEFSKELGEEIKKIVVADSYHQLTIESSTDDKVSLFGTYRTNNPELKGYAVDSIEDFASIKNIGDTLYISLKDPPRKTGWNSDYTTLKATLVIPADVRLEVRGASDDIILRPASIEGDWLVENASTVSVHAEEEDDVTIRALSADYLQAYDLNWDVVEHSEDDEEIQAHSSEGMIELGSGKNKVEILKAHQVSAYLN